MIDHFCESIYGWFDFQNLYSRILRELPENAHVVEIGAFLGKSSAYLGVEAYNLNKNIKIDVIDTFQGSPNENNGENAITEWIRGHPETTIYDTFMKNMECILPYINVIKGNSIEVVNQYEDESLDFVFIDSDHSYNQIYNEIKSYLPKIKKGGYIGGHDALYPDVQKALVDHFGYDFKLEEHSWYHKKDNICRLKKFKNGWFIGNFLPTLLKTKDFEVAIQKHPKGFTGHTHYHKKSTEYNVVVSGKVKINGQIKEAEDIFVFNPYEISESEFLEDTTIVVVRTPSEPTDKYIV